MDGCFHGLRHNFRRIPEGSAAECAEDDNLVSFRRRNAQDPAHTLLMELPQLLLPNLEGVDTVEEQIAIAKQKAGIPKHVKDVRLERFEVVRHF